MMYGGRRKRKNAREAIRRGKTNSITEFCATSAKRARRKPGRGCSRAICLPAAKTRGRRLHAKRRAYKGRASGLLAGGSDDGRRYERGGNNYEM